MLSKSLSELGIRYRSNMSESIVEILNLVFIFVLNSTMSSPIGVIFWILDVHTFPSPGRVTLKVKLFVGSISVSVIRI
jgi:hypothetical protein